jgi:hypothetical protein
MTGFELETYQRKLPEGARIVSNSEVSSFLDCERKHFFGFILNVEPKRKSRALSIGITGHEVLAAYYTAIKEGGTKKDGYQAGAKVLTQFMILADTNDEIETIAVLQSLFARYVQVDSIAETTEILEVEKDFYLPVNESFWYGMRLDLLVRALSGRNQNYIYLVDHKFTYDFFSFDDLKLNPQTPKYIGVLRNAGIPVEDGYLNQFRTRFPAHLIKQKPDEDLFQNSPTGVKPERIRNAFKQQLIASERIMDRRSLPIELQEMEALPVMNRMVCRNCPFKAPCEMMEEGIDYRPLIRSNYQARTYGYNEEA